MSVAIASVIMLACLLVLIGLGVPMALGDGRNRESIYDFPVGPGSLFGIVAARWAG